MISLQMTRVGTETGSACRSEEAGEKEPVALKPGGAGEALAWDRIPRVMPREVGRPWQLWEGGGESSVARDREQGPPFILALPCPLARNLTSLCAQEPLHSLASFPGGYPRPCSYLSPALPPTRTPKHPLPSPRTPGMRTLAAPRSPARGLTSSGVRRAEST